MQIIRRLGILVFSALIPLLAGLPSAYSQTRLAVPSYQNPGTDTWQGWQAQGPGAVGIMIVNLSGGDDPAYYPEVDDAVRNARKQGIHVLGYTHTTYGARDPKLIRQAIDAVYQNYLVDGIFFDEAPTDCSASNSYFPTQFLYYQELTNYVRQKTGARITVLNPGTYSPSNCWMSITNILVNWENVGFPTYQSSYVDYSWVHQYPPDRFWHVILGVPQAQLQATLNLARARNAGWVYISESPDNAYNQVPAYWSAEGAAIVQQGVQAPFATTWPSSLSSTGGTMNARVSFRWRAVNGTVWHLYLDTDQNLKTGYRGGQLSIGAEYMLEASSAGIAKLYRYTGSGTNWSWSVVQANAQISFPDPGINLVAFDQVGLRTPTALSYQFQSLDQNYNLLYSSYVMPLSLNNTGFVYDIMNH